MKLSEEIQLAAPPRRVWDVLWDVGRLARALPGAKDIREVVPHKRYEAVIDERVGPLAMRFPLQLEVLEADPPRRLTAQASGRDPKLGSSFQATFELVVRNDGKGSRLAINADFEIRGAMAAFAQGIIRQRAGAAMTAFADALRREVEGEAGGGTQAG